MRSVTVTLLLTSAAKAYAVELAANQSSYRHDSLGLLVDKLADKLIDQVPHSVDKLVNDLVDRLVNPNLKALPLHHADLDGATLGKPGRLATTQSKPLSNARTHRPQSRGQAPPGLRMHPGVLDGQTWAQSIALTPCAQLRAPQHKRLQPAMVTALDRESLAEKTSVQTQIEEMIALQPLVIFSKTTCPFCAQAKEAFQKIGVTRTPTVELDKLEPKVAEQIQDHLMTLTGARTVPRVFVGHEFIGGGSDVKKLADDGELKTIVEKAMQAQKDDLAGKDISKGVSKSEDEWRKELSPEVYNILRQRGTERPGSHEYDQFYPDTGYFSCAGCGLPLYSADSKFKSNCGWPVFDKCYHSEEVGCHVCTRPDGTGSLEIVCPKCTGHLGHVFFDSFTAENPNGERH